MMEECSAALVNRSAAGLVGWSHLESAVAAPDAGERVRSKELKMKINFG